MRKLASIQKIRKLHKLPQFDNLLLAEVLGWKCLAGKDEFQEGDLCVYFEIDSIVPDKDCFRFMEKHKFRVKTIKIRGIYSQGLCMPLNKLNLSGDFQEGQDITELLGVIKFEDMDRMYNSGDRKGKFPDFIPRTEEIRIQSVPGVIDRWKGRGVNFYITEKLDGSSVTLYFLEGQFGVCTRNMELKEVKNNIIWQAVRQYDIEEKLKKYVENMETGESVIYTGKGYALQGEIVGPKVQGNKYKLKDHRIYFFNAFNIATGNYENVFDICKKLELETVPLLYEKFSFAENTVDSFVELAKGKSALNDGILREGIVIRSLDETLRDPELNRLSFKVINPDFLIKHNC